MTGQLFIDGVDVYNEFGAFVADGGYADLISPANLKDVEYNDWPEIDGIEPDLHNPVLDTKELILPFYSVSNKKTEDFLCLLSDKSYHLFELQDIQQKRTLRLLHQASKETIATGESFSLKFADDFPLNGYTYQPPIGMINQTGFYMDNKPLSDYGVLILDGSYDEIMKVPAVKNNLSQSYKKAAGLIYDNNSVVYQHKNVALKCALVVSDIYSFWRNYNALIYDLIRPDQRLFHVESANDTFSCFYKSLRVSKYSITRGQCWCEFILTLVFTDFRPKQTVSVLGTEDRNMLTTEDIRAIIIDK